MLSIFSREYQINLNAVKSPDFKNTFSEKAPSWIKHSMGNTYRREGKYVLLAKAWKKRQRGIMQDIWKEFPPFSWHLTLPLHVFPLTWQLSRFWRTLGQWYFGRELLNLSSQMHKTSLYNYVLTRWKMTWKYFPSENVEIGWVTFSNHQRLLAQELEKSHFWGIYKWDDPILKQQLFYPPLASMPLIR